MKKGDFIKIDFTASIVDTGKVFDTTKKETAEKNNLNPEAEYKPTDIIVGERFVVLGLDDELLNHNVGESFEIEIPPERAFGVRLPSFLRLLPMSDFKKKDIYPYPGLTLNVDDSFGVVRSVSGGRVTVDFNHPLAGKKIKYSVTILEKIEKKEEQAKVLTSFYGIKDAEVKLNENKLEITTKTNIPKVVKDVIIDSMKKNLNIQEVNITETSNKTED